MTNQVEHSGIYERLVSDDHDFLGQAAYSLYKARKREFIISKQMELGTPRVPEEVVNEFIKAQTERTLDLYRNQANGLFREFLDTSYGKEIAEEKHRLDQEYSSKYEKLADAVKPPSFWYGVLQSFVASFLFVLAGYIILKMSGSWDILLNNLFK